MKADHPKRPSPFAQILKTYKFEGGEITKWFIDAWDHFGSFEEATAFMVEQIEEKKYRAFCFQTDWPAVIDKFINVRISLRQENLTAQQQGKLFATLGSDDEDISDHVMNFTSQFVVAGSNARLPPFVLKAAINHLNKL